MPLLGEVNSQRLTMDSTSVPVARLLHGILVPVLLKAITMPMFSTSALEARLLHGCIVTLLRLNQSKESSRGTTLCSKRVPLRSNMTNRSIIFQSPLLSDVNSQRLTMDSTSVPLARLLHGILIPLLYEVKG